MKLSDHPTVRKHAAASATTTDRPRIDAELLRQLALEVGADDVGLVELERPALAGERKHVLRNYPWCRSAIAFVVRLNREPIRSTLRSVSNLEFHTRGDETNHISQKLVRRLEDLGVRAVNPSMGFPMEMDQFPGRLWAVSHKLFAVEAGLGSIGIHRNVIHPRFGNFILLGTVLLDHELDRTAQPLDFNPCLECKLCVTACPVGAIHSDGGFDFSACMNHNYREFMGGFSDWVEQVVDSKNIPEYRQRVNDAETSSMWQSLSFGANYKSAYCLAVCPAGEDVIGPFLENRKQFVQDVVAPLRDKEEPLYVVAGSDAERHARKRSPHKTLREASHGLRPRTVQDFLSFLPIMLQRGATPAAPVRYHMRFRGSEVIEATVVLDKDSVQVANGLHGEPDLVLRADSKSWLRFLAGERAMLGLLLRGKVRVRGRLALLPLFGRCFPRPRARRRKSALSS